MFIKGLTITMGLLLSLSVMILLGRVQEEEPILEGLVDYNSHQATTLYALYDDYRDALKPELACIALNQAIHAQEDKQQKIRWEEEFLTSACRLVVFNSFNRHSIR